MVVKRKHEEMEAAEKVDMTAPAPPQPGGSSSRKMQGQSDNKHSIDSDEEDDDRTEHEKFDKIHEDDIEGQEDDSEMMMDGDIKVTPFNLKEERQEGEFSKDGNFVWAKKDEVNDAWLDNIDWIKIKQKSKAEADKEEAEEDAEDQRDDATGAATSQAEDIVAKRNKLLESTERVKDEKMASAAMSLNTSASRPKQPYLGSVM